MASTIRCFNLVLNYKRYKWILAFLKLRGLVKKLIKKLVKK